MTGAVDPLIAQAQALESPAPADSTPVAPPVVDPDWRVTLAAPLAKMLDSVAVVLGEKLPFVPKHFSHAANVAIAESFCELAVEYHWDMNVLQGRAGMWIALAMSAGLPGYACYQDYRAMMAKPAAPPSPAAAPSPTVQ